MSFQPKLWGNAGHPLSLTYLTPLAFNVPFLLCRIRKRSTGISTGIRRFTWTTQWMIRRRRSDTLWSTTWTLGRRTSLSVTDWRGRSWKIWNCFTFLSIHRSINTCLYIYNSLSFTPGLKPTSFTNPTPRSFTFSSLPPLTFAWTASSELLSFWLDFFLIFSFLGRALDYAGHLVSFWAHVNVPYRIVRKTRTVNYEKCDKMWYDGDVNACAQRLTSSQLNLPETEKWQKELKQLKIRCES